MEKLYLKVSNPNDSETDRWEVKDATLISEEEIASEKKKMIKEYKDGIKELLSMYTNDLAQAKSTETMAKYQSIILKLQKILMEKEPETAFANTAFWEVVLPEGYQIIKVGEGEEHE